MELKIYGRSDDSIEVEGDIEEEFGAYDTVKFIAVSGGTLIKIHYSDNGTWDIKLISKGNNEVELIPHEGSDSDKYTDIAIIKSTSPEKWVVCGEGIFS